MLIISSISGIIVSIGILLSCVCVTLVSIPYFFVYGNLILLSLTPWGWGDFKQRVLHSKIASAYHNFMLGPEMRLIRKNRLKALYSGAPLEPPFFLM